MPAAVQPEGLAAGPAAMLQQLLLLQKYQLQQLPLLLPAVVTAADKLLGQVAALVQLGHQHPCVPLVHWLVDYQALCKLLYDVQVTVGLLLQPSAALRSDPVGLLPHAPVVQVRDIRSLEISSGTIFETIISSEQL